MLPARAAKALRAGDAETALQAAQDAVKEDPKSALGWYLAGLARLAVAGFAKGYPSKLKDDAAEALAEAAEKAWGLKESADHALLRSKAAAARG